MSNIAEDMHNHAPEIAYGLKPSQYPKRYQRIILYYVYFSLAYGLLNHYIYEFFFWRILSSPLRYLKGLFNSTVELVGSIYIWIWRHSAHFPSVSWMVVMYLTLFSLAAIYITVMTVEDYESDALKGFFSGIFGIVLSHISVNLGFAEPYFNIKDTALEFIHTIFCNRIVYVFGIAMIMLNLNTIPRFQWLNVRALYLGFFTGLFYIVIVGAFAYPLYEYYYVNFANRYSAPEGLIFNKNRYLTVNLVLMSLSVMLAFILSKIVRLKTMLNRREEVQIQNDNMIQKDIDSETLKRRILD